MARQYGPRIQIDTDTWIVMREVLSSPKAIIHRVTDISGTSRYLVMVWREAEADRRMVGIYDDLSAAEKAVPWQRVGDGVPGPPGLSPEESLAELRERKDPARDFRR